MRATAANPPVPGTSPNRAHAARPAAACEHTPSKHHTPHAYHAWLPRPGRRAHADSKLPAGGQPAGRWRSIIHIAPWATYTARPPPPADCSRTRAQTHQGAWRGVGGTPRGSPRPPDSPHHGLTPGPAGPSAPAPAPRYADSYLVCVLDLHVAAAAAAGLARLVRILVLPPHQEDCSDISQ